MMALVSAIMPTRGRGIWSKLAVDCFLRQTYPNKELVIIDDADDRSFCSTIGIGDASLQYHLYPRQRNIAWKRNEACRMARGGIIIHWDSDDWSDSKRMAEQVAFLEESGKRVTGYNTLLFCKAQPEPEWGRYIGAPTYSLGTSLCYFRSFWEVHPFDEGLTVGEDNEFVSRACAEGAFISQPGNSMMVARVHPGNTSPKDMGNFSRAVSPDEIPAGYLA